MEARFSWLVALCMSLLLVPLSAQGNEKFSLTAAFEPATARPGSEVKLVLRAEVVDGWHAYGSMETINVPVALSPEKLTLHGLELAGAAKVPGGIPKAGPIGMQYPLPNKFQVVQMIKVPTSLSGTVRIEGALDYQICDEGMCEPPTEMAFSAALEVAGEPIEQEPGEQQPAEQAQPSSSVPNLGLKPGLFLDSDEKVTLRATFEPATARPGEYVTLVLHAVTQDGWHAYGTRETLQIPVGLDPGNQDVGDLEFVGDPIIPPGEPKESFGETRYQLGHEFEVKQVLRVPADADAGGVEIAGAMSYQVCNEVGCDPETDAEFGAVLKIEAGDVRDEYREAPAAPQDAAENAEPAEGSDEPAKAGKQKDKSWWGLILACIGGGLFALAMPCTYPMIPITFSFFTKQAENRGGKVLPLALMYGLGIVAMFVFVGVGLSAVIIDVVNHWVTNTIIGVMFIFFAFVLFGWVNLSPPQWMNRMAGKASGTGGLLGVFFMGATLVITSFTCTAPIVGSLIANVAKEGSLRVGIGMAIFGLTMAIPFVFLSLAPGKVKKMPSAGQWMDTLKVSLGFVELAAALKFVSVVDFAFGWQILPRELFLMLWAAIFGMWAMFLFGILRKAGTVNEGVSNGRMAAGMGVTLLTAYFLFGAMGNRLDDVMTGFIPGYSNSLIARGGGEKQHSYELVKDDPKKAASLAIAQDKLLLYNFTGFN